MIDDADKFGGKSPEAIMFSIKQDSRYSAECDGESDQGKGFEECIVMFRNSQCMAGKEGRLGED